MFKPLAKDNHLFSSFLFYTLLFYSIPNTTAFWTFSLPPHRSCFRVFKAGFRWLLSRKTASRLHGLSSPLHYSRHCYRLTIMSPCRGKALVRLWSRLWSRHSLLSPPLISLLYFVHFLLREVLSWNQPVLHEKQHLELRDRDHCLSGTT